MTTKYRIAQNVIFNKGFYVRPDDEFSFTPSKVFPTAEAAWRDHEIQISLSHKAKRED